MKAAWSTSGIAILAALISGCHGSGASQPAQVESMTAHLVASRRMQIPSEIRATGTVHAKETAIISAQVIGRIEQVLVREGDAVRPGQTLAILDRAALEQSADQARAALAAAQNQQSAAQSNAALAASTLARYKQLQSDKSVSPQEMDEVSRRAEAAQAQFEAAQAQTLAVQAQAGGAQTMLGYARLKAPFAGIVTARTADPGTLAAPGVPLLQIDRAGALQLNVTVDESSISAVHNGARLEVTIDSFAEPVEGIVTSIVPAADPASHSFLVKIDLPASKQLHAGVYGAAAFSSGTQSAILVPSSAVVMRGSLNCAYAIDGQGIARLRYLTLGSKRGDLVEVLSGVSPDEQLIDSPADRDFAGKRIMPQSGAGQ